MNNRTTTTLLEENAILFATASTEMWQRALHTLIIAVALRRSSAAWASIAGYYASHYSVRAFAHLFGYFALYFQGKAFVEISQWGGRFQCGPVSSLSRRAYREHQFYWEVVRNTPELATDRLFTANNDQVQVSDASHRGVASYMDHLNRFEQFHGTDRGRIRLDIAQLAQTALSGEQSIGIPDRERFPQLSVVLSLAYLRVYRFREYLDQLLPVESRFWKQHRSPNWASDLLVFPDRGSQAIEP